MKNLILKLATAATLVLALACGGKNKDTTVAVSGVTLPAVLTVEAPGTAELRATITPDNANNKNVSWTSSDPTKVTVPAGNNSTTITVTGVAPGTSTITVTTADGNKTATCTVTAVTPVLPTSVTISPKPVEFEVGGTATLTAAILPADATNKNVTWSINPPSGVATLSGTGLTRTVTGTGAGTATVTVTTAAGNRTDTCQVTVRQQVVHPTGVAISPKPLSIGRGTSATLTATVNPPNADNKNVTWSISPTTFATLSATTGSTITVTGTAQGTATVTVTTVDGAKTDTCAVEVTAPVPLVSVSLTPSPLTVASNRTASLTATPNPANASVASYTWTSSDPTKATVPSGTQPGTITVTGVAQGSTTITVTARDADGGTKTATCNVTVGPPATDATYIGFDTGLLMDNAAQAAYNGQVINAVDVASNIVYACGYDPSAGKPTFWKNGVKTVLPLSAGMTGGEAKAICIENGTAYVAGYELNDSDPILAKLWVISSAGAVTTPALPDFEALGTTLDQGIWAFGVCRLNGNTYMCGGVDSYDYYSDYYEYGVGALVVWNLTPGTTSPFAIITYESMGEADCNEAYSIAAGADNTLYVGCMDGLISLNFAAMQYGTLIDWYEGCVYSVKYQGGATPAVYACGYLDSNPWPACYWRKAGTAAATVTELPKAPAAEWAEARDMFITSSGVVHCVGNDDMTGEGDLAPKYWIGTAVQNIAGWSGNTDKGGANTIVIK